MNISRILPVNYLQNKSNAQNMHSSKMGGLKCDTVSFRGKNEIVFDEILIYHDYFDAVYNQIENDVTRNKINKKIDEFRNNGKLSPTVVHKINDKDNCCSINEYKCRGDNAYRILFRIIDKKMVIIAAFDKDNEYKNNVVIDKAINISNSGKLEAFVAQHNAQKQIEEDAESPKEEKEVFNQADLEAYIKAKEDKKCIEENAQNLRKMCLDNARVNIGLIDIVLEDAPEEIAKELVKNRQKVYEMCMQIEALIDVLLRWEGENGLSVDELIEDVSNKVFDLYDELDALTKYSLGFAEVDDQNGIDKDIDDTQDIYIEEDQLVETAKPTDDAEKTAEDIKIKEADVVCDDLNIEEVQIQDKKEYITQIIEASSFPIKVIKFPSFELPAYAKQTFDIVEKDLAKTMTKGCANDITIQLIESIGRDGVNSLKELNEAEFIQLLTSKMAEISQTPEYKTAIRATNIAFLNEIDLCSRVSNEKIYELPASQVAKLQEEISQGKKEIVLEDEFGKEVVINLDGELDFDNIEANYRNLSYHMSKSEIEALIEKVSEYADDISYNDMFDYLSNQGSYLTLINDETTSRTLKNRLLKYLFSDFDKINNTNYTSTVLKEIDKEKIENRINFFTSDDILADIDF